MHCDIYTGIINEKMRLSLQHHDAVPLFNSGKNPAAFRFSASMCHMLDQQWIKYINSNYFQTIILTQSAFCKSGAHVFSIHAADTSIF